jgi:hypothetical protein
MRTGTFDRCFPALGEKDFDVWRKSKSREPAMRPALILIDQRPSMVDVHFTMASLAIYCTIEIRGSYGGN